MKKIYTYILGIASLLLPSCSDYFDINTDPNNPSDVDYTTLVPTIQLYGTRALCTSSGLSNELIVYTHQFSTREEANEYGVTGADFYTTYGWQYIIRKTKRCGFPKRKVSKIRKFQKRNVFYLFKHTRGRETQNNPFPCLLFYTFNSNRTSSLPEIKLIVLSMLFS